MFNRSTNLILGLILLTVAAIKVVIAFRLLEVGVPFIFGDAYVYTSKALALINEGHLGYQVNHYGGPSVPPLFSILISVPIIFAQLIGDFSNFSLSYHFLIVGNVVLSLLSIVFAYALANHWVGPAKALFPAVLVALYSAGWGYSTTLLSENIFIPVVLLFFLALKSFDEREDETAALMLTIVTPIVLGAKVVGIAALFTLAVYAIYRFATKRKAPLFALFVGITVSLIIMFSSEQIAPEILTGYDVSKYRGQLFANFTDFTEFKGMILSGLRQLGFLSLATLGLPLAGALAAGKKERGFTIALATFTICLLGFSVLHLNIFSKIDPDRYIVYGRYLDGIVPVILAVGSAALLRNGLSHKLTAAYFAFFAAITILFFPFLRSLDPINNYGVFFIANHSVHFAVPLVISILLFITVLLSRKYMAALLLIVFVWVSAVSSIGATKYNLHEASIFKQKIAWAYDLPQGEVAFYVPTTQDLWDYELTQEWWGASTWLNHRIKLIHELDEAENSSYLVVPKELPISGQQIGEGEGVFVYDLRTQT